MGEVFQFHREIIVSGDDPLSKTIAEELRGAGARIIPGIDLSSTTELRDVAASL